MIAPFEKFIHLFFLVPRVTNVKMRLSRAGRIAVFTACILRMTLAEPFTPVPSWNVTSSTGIIGNTTQLSLPGIDTSSWHHLNASKGTLMATLLASGIYNEDDLFYSDTLKTVDPEQFRVPWFYRSESRWITKSNTANDFYTLRTNGISSRADVYLNGHLVADRETQAGAYVGLEYDVTDKVRRGGRNVLLVKAYPTDYNRDFALGFVDWNPYPPDNGTGIWRDVEVKRTGQVSLGMPRVRTTLEGEVTVYVDAKNIARNATARGGLECAVYDPQGSKTGVLKTGFDLAPAASTTLTVKATIANPQLWWPRQWGEQPLYSIQCHASIRNVEGTSDVTPKTKFGIRIVTSTLDTTYNDTTFHINGHPFQVLGAGYTSDIFLRFDELKLRVQLEYVLDMGMNTMRLEGKQEHPRLYEMADEMGIMLLAGWECCDKWEGWSFNDEGSGFKWDDADYRIANLSMRHEAAMMQHHPSLLGFLVGSDFWPDDRATAIYVSALKAMNWDTPILASASQRGAPDQLGNGGMKMDGPYDWVPPNYWFDDQQRLGSAGGFGSELGAGVGTPSLASLQRFLSQEDMDDLWKSPEKGLYHMSTNVSSFYTRSIYNDALWNRYGKPTSLEDYLLKSQMLDYEATKSQFEAYLSRWNAAIERPATGMIYWMLNNAWPSLHWSLFDFYLERTAAYFGVKAALSKLQHVVFDYQSRDIYLVDRRLASHSSSARTVDIDLVDPAGKTLVKQGVKTSTTPNSATNIGKIPLPSNHTSVSFLRLTLTDPSSKEVLSSNTYTLAPSLDEMDWDNSTWYHTPVTKYANYSVLWDMETAELEVKVEGGKVVVRNKSKVPAVGVRLSGEGGMRWGENWLTLWGGEEKVVEYEGGGYGGGGYGGRKVVVDGVNIARQLLSI
jgi:exo-1,4-beta-D-glucosaminidase